MRNTHYYTKPKLAAAVDSPPKDIYIRYREHTAPNHFFQFYTWWKSTGTNNRNKNHSAIITTTVAEVRKKVHAINEKNENLFVSSQPFFWKWRFWCCSRNTSTNKTSPVVVIIYCDPHTMDNNMITSLQTFSAKENLKNRCFYLHAHRKKLSSIFKNSFK